MGQIILDSANDLIQGDFDNATLNNRTKFRTTTTNATTNVYVVPNGTATSAGVSISNNSNLTNASKVVMATNGNTDTQIISGINGSGTYLPLSFYTNDALAMQIGTNNRVSFVAGTAALPAITTTGDTNTGILFPAADTIAFAEGGVERMRLDANGNVMMNASAPQYTSSVTPSFVCPSIQRNYTVRVNQNGGNWVNFWLLDTSTDSFAATIDITGTENGSFNIYTARWSLVYGAAGGTTLTGPFNAAQLGNDYARPDLRVSGGFVQIKSSNNLSTSAINGFITMFTTR